MAFFDLKKMKKMKKLARSKWAKHGIAPSAVVSLKKQSRHGSSCNRNTQHRELRKRTLAATRKKSNKPFSAAT
jgi:hypothetical protein